MKTYADIDVTGNVRIFVFGPPGVGKTSFVSTWPGLAIADCDNNLHVLKSRDYLDRFGKPDLVCYETIVDPVDKKTGIVQNATGINRLIDFLNEVSEMDDVQTIVIDSTTAVQVLAMNLGVELTGQTGQSKAKARQKKNRILIPTIADFGAEIATFKQLMNQLSALEKTVICIAHDKEEVNNEGQVLSRSPALIGTEPRNSIGKWFQEVWYLGVVRGIRTNRVLLTQNTNQIEGLKSAAFSLPPEMEDPTHAKIMEHVMNQT